MLTQLVIAALLAGLIYVGYRAWRASSASRIERAAAPSPSQATVEQVRPGGVIQLPPHGEHLDPRDVQITARHIYREDGFEWSELEGDSGEATVWLDVERDDALETSVTLRRLGLDAIGLTPERLETVKPGATETIEFDERRFRFTERGTATFYARGDRDRPEALEYWDFANDDDGFDLGIERWNQEYTAYLTQRLDPHRIRIYSLGGEPA